MQGGIYRLDGPKEVCTCPDWFMNILATASTRQVAKPSRRSTAKTILGPHGTKASKAEYDRLIAWWLANGRDSLRLSPGDDARLTVSEMILRYWLFAKQHYRRDGQPTRELDNIRDALRPLRELFGPTPAALFGPKALKTLRNVMIQSGLARSTINFRISKVRRAFRWAVENELVKPEVYQGLTAVPGLRPGRDGVRETHPVTTVPETHVAAVLPYVSGPVRAMIQA